MEDSNTSSLFGSDKLVIPQDIKVHDELIYGGIEEAIKQDRIDTVLVEKTDDIEEKANIIDLTGITNILDCVLVTISKMLVEKPDKENNRAVYIKTGNWAGRIGYSNDFDMYDKIESFIWYIFNNKCKMYRRDSISKGFKEVKRYDTKYVRLNL